MIALLVLHAVLAACAPALARALGPRRAPRVFAVMAVPPALTTGWAMASGAAVLRGEPVEQTLSWVPGLSLDLALRLDPLALLMVTLVSGVGTLVFLYCPSYVAGHSTREGREAVRYTARFAGTLLAFSGAMLGLVLADDLLSLYIFWEATSITSFLLVGLNDEDSGSRGAALQALLVTVLGGLAMLVGFVILGESAGTYRISEIVASPPTGGLVEVGLLLVLLGAFTKSAQLPFHPWLPSAMAAPTPVSAYLHAAAMVKAGVYLVARLTPAFADEAVWTPLVVTFGVATMLVGGYRALRQHDLKRLLAFGTVSQLGFLMVLVGGGTRETAVAGATLLLAHGLFKSTLFLTIGVIDTQTHTRDIRQLAGLGRRMPWLAGAAVLAGLSMAGLPPLFGFLAKEEAYAAYLHGGPGGLVTLAGLVVGSVLTFAYTARLLWGAFADKGCPPSDAVTHAERPAAVFTAPVVVLGVASLVLGLVPALVDPLVQAVADRVEVGKGEHLALWHGLNAELALSALTVAVGTLLFWQRRPVTRVQARLHTGPVHLLDADRGYHATVLGLDVLAARTTASVMSGSLPAYLALTLVTMLALPGTALLLTTGLPSDVRLYDTWLQPAVGVVIALAAVATAFARRRFTAVLFLGAAGYGVAVLFVIHGGPDLALTQFLVETLSLVIFVFALRRLPPSFSTGALRRVQVVRALIAGAVGVLVTGFAVVAVAARSTPPVSQAFLDLSQPKGGGNNVVNVILVDFRGFDTLGEITVVAVASMGIAGLVLAGRRAGGEQAPATASPGAEDAPTPDPAEVPEPSARRPDAVRETDSPHSAQSGAAQSASAQSASAQSASAQSARARGGLR